MHPRPTAEFQPATTFEQDLRQRVDAYFAATGLPRRGDPRMFVKTAVIVAAILLSYGLLLLRAHGVAGTLGLAAALAVSIGALGFSVAHDANHGAYSERPWLNRLMGSAYDAIGASSYLWRWKHNVLHHSYPNVPELDEDIQRQPFFRLTPAQRRRGAHRFQHLYAWPLYGLLVIKWQLFSDFHDLARGKTGPHPFARPQGRELALFWAGKLGFVLWAFVLPALFHPLSAVLLVYLFTSFTLSLIMSTVFQAAHCYEDASADRLGPSRRLEREWARHQVETAADFGRGNRWLSWYVGGLNFQVEHHLFPGVSHIHYPALAPLVEEACRRHGVRYTAFGSLRAAVASHQRWLRRMGREGYSSPGAPIARATSAADLTASS